MQVGAGLHLDTDDVGSSLGEVGHVALRLNDHQVHVQGLGRDRAQGLHDQGTDRDVGHEAAIHHIHMDPVGAGLVDGTHVLAKAGEIGRKDRRGDHQGLGAHGGATGAQGI